MSFSQKLLAWFERHGRHDLPWQQNPTPYRVWVSEVMLQQTQVATVIGYYDRFMARFPALGDLAAADEETVLGLWAGLGYYARARNLHKAAKIAFERWGDLVADETALGELPGIGRSTAAAIVALSTDRRAVILDGNVKRVLSRYSALQAPPSAAATLKRLWVLSEQVTPQARAAAYTQAIMDLGAMLCTRAKPACERCPVGADCLAYAQGLQNRLPLPAKRPERPVRRVWLVLVLDEAGRVALFKQPAKGVWGGLYAPVQLPIEENPADRYGKPCAVLAPIRHGFTHFVLEMTPYPVFALGAFEGAAWVHPAHPEVPLPAPVARLLEHLAQGAAWPAPARCEADRR